ncbi:hypothetical protein FQN54_004481 [Arachnomyces sp. PD_36]|nr:hypothetical protein FQN54_004481 [Arachnomyces sp. PD_36]
MFVPTARCLAAKPAGFLKRSVDEFARVSKLAWNLETLAVPKKPYHLLDFEDESTVAGCKTMADRAVGGFSTANLDYVPADPATNTPAHARFHGSISTKLPLNWRVQRTGYAAFRNMDRGMWLFGHLYWDMDPYAYLALRVKSDGRRYTINVQTESIIETDIHQHRLYTRHHHMSQPPSSSTDPDVPPALSDFPPPSTTIASATTSPNPDSTGWETVLVRWSDFVRTDHGMVIEPQTGMITQKIKSIGIGLTDRVEGPYELCIHRMWGTNGLSEAELEEERRICGKDALDVAADPTDDSTIVEREGKGAEKKLKGLKKLGKEWDK